MSQLDSVWFWLVAIFFFSLVALRLVLSVFGSKSPKAVKPRTIDVGPAASVVSIQGARSYQEDKYNATLNLRSDPQSALYGVYDGHGGSRASEFVSENLHKLFGREKFQQQLDEDPCQLLRTTFHQIEHDFLQIADRYQLEDGTTAVAALLHKHTLYVANVGDSRAVLASGGKAIPMSSDHKPDRPDEKARVEGLGGKITHYGTWRVQGVLAVTRAFGDRLLKPYVIADPEIRTRKLEDNDDYLILATDGVWDVISCQEAVDMVLTSGDVHMASQRIAEAATLRRSMDNITVLVVDLRFHRAKKIK